MNTAAIRDKQNEILKSSAMWMVSYFWRLVNPQTMTQYQLLALLYSKVSRRSDRHQCSQSVQRKISTHIKKIFVAGVRAGAEHAAAGLPPVLRGGGRLLHPPQVRAPRRQGSRPVILRRIGEASLSLSSSSSSYGEKNISPAFLLYDRIDGDVLFLLVILLVITWPQAGQ